MKNLLSLTRKPSTDLLDNYCALSTCQRAQMIIKKAYYSATDYNNGQHYSTLTDLTSQATAFKIYKKMMRNQTGRLILEQKPRITDEFYQQLGKLEQNTFGKQYYDFMQKQNFKPSQRPTVNFINNIDLAYVLQRYKEIHDFLHQQLLLKWFQMRQLELPSATLASLISPFMKPSLTLEQISKIIKLADKSQFILNIYFQKQVEQNIEIVRKKFGFDAI